MRQDLAKLTGAGYFTWSEPEAALHPTGAVSASTAKHLNYAPEPAAFVALLRQAVAYVTAPAGHDEL